MKQQEAKRANAEYTITINTPAADIFPLACPVEEEKWIYNWDYTMVYSESGRNELGCVFIETMSARHILGPDSDEKTYWVTTKHDPNEEIRFLLVRSSTVTQLEITIDTIDTRQTRITWNMTMTSIKEEANGKFDESVEERMLLMLTFLGQSLKHYCDTGEKLIISG